VLSGSNLKVWQCSQLIEKRLLDIKTRPVLIVDRTVDRKGSLGTTEGQSKFQ
jgi:hypothetical protein